MSKQQRFVRTTPKRALERVYTQTFDLIDNTVTLKTLRTVGAPETLVRTIVDLIIIATNVVANTVYTWQVMIAVRPQNVQVEPAVSSEELANEEPKQVIFKRFGIAEMITLSGAASQQEIHVDLSGMRKLKSGDLVSLHYISSGADVLQIGGSIVQFFKQT